LYKFENLVPFKGLPLWLAAMIPVPLPLLETVSKILNQNAVKGCQWFSLNLCNIRKMPPFQIPINPWGEKKVARSEVRWDATTILFLATSEAFYWHCRGSMRIAGGPWQYFGWRFYTMFSAVGVVLVSLHSITEGTEGD
jgi:hypothetical protein